MLPSPAREELGLAWRKERQRASTCAIEQESFQRGQFTNSFRQILTMSSMRLSRAALRARSAVIIKPIQRRGYADAVSDKIKLSLALPHSVRAQASVKCSETLHLLKKCASDGYWLMLRISRLSTNLPMCTSFSSVHYGAVLSRDQ
jgi:hypothetical protein